ncbi:C2H2-type domain-containing protein [Plasmodiophora brassicae]|uniref:C2H2-type domain-containing protein n=1 Tax=Plasmodiophora brassicae TaxID=37360 RepID=A0A3P3YL12_PLABS|nr:unnamed protein product [Plasmodiophora brassicae]
MRCLADGIRRRRDADDPFFDLGDASRQCYVEWWTGDARARFQDLHRQLASAPAVPCRKPLCGHVAPSVGALVAHIAAEHRHPCYVCGRVFPSDHLVHRHLQETHDPLFAILAARQRMYECLDPSCHRKFNTGRGRRLHMIDGHGWHPTYRFDRRHRRPPSADDNDAAALADALRGMRVRDRVPARLSFGRRRTPRR